MNRTRHRIRWFALSSLTVGMLFQTTGTTCASLTADAAAGLSVSIVNEVIRNNVNQALGLGSISSLTSFN